MELGQQRDRPREAPPYGSEPSGSPPLHRDQAGDRRGSDHRGLPRRDRDRPLVADAGLPAAGGRLHDRAPGGHDELRRGAAIDRGVHGRVRKDSRRSKGVDHAHRRADPTFLVWLTRRQMAAIIEVEKLTKSYGSKRGITDVSFRVEEGEVFGFLGPNGAGKTTTIRTLMALLRADSGKARIAGLDSWDKSLEIKRIVGYMPGEPALDPNLSGGQILEYFTHLGGGVERAYLKQLIERFDLDTSRKFRQYSTGNKRKVVLIQAFMHRPRVLILDEPTSGLDPLNQQEFDRLVKEARDDGRTVFLSSHVLSEVEKTCTRVGIIRDGSLVRIGGISEVSAIKRYEITITFANPVPVETFKALDGVAEVESLDQGRGVRLAMQGPADAVIKAAALYPVVSLTSHEPSLEDIFLRYYEGNGVPAREAQGVA